MWGKLEKMNKGNILVIKNVVCEEIMTRVEDEKSKIATDWKLAK